MANYYYVKYDESDATDGQGTATGDGGRVATTPRTGTWSTTVTEFYADMTAVLAATTPPAAGDFVYFSHLHDKDYAGADKSYNPAEGVSLVSVDDANQDQYLRGAQLVLTTIVDGSLGRLTFNTSNTCIIGFDFRVSYELVCNSHPIFIDCNVYYSYTFFQRVTAPGGHAITFIGGSINGLGSGHTSTLGSAGSAYFRGVTIDWRGPLCTTGNDNGSFQFDDCDFSASTLSFDLIAGNQAEYVDYFFNRCLMPPNVTDYFATSSMQVHSHLKISDCTKMVIGGADDNDVTWFEHYTDGAGSVESNLTDYLSATFDEIGTGFSAEMSSSAYCGIGTFIRHKLVSLPAQILSTSISVKVNFISEDALNTNDFWVEAVHNDNTSNALGVTVSTRPADILAGAAHTTNTASWTDTYTTPVKQEVTVTIPALASITGKIGTVDIYVCLAKASVDVNVDPAVVVI
jgi:hypothetical protein